jgi:hypothetical protein
MVGFCGCSLTEGVGVQPHEAYPILLNGNNYAERGSNNAMIFHQAVQALSENKHVVVQWASAGRNKFFPTVGESVFTKGMRDVEGIPNREARAFSNVYQMLDTEYNQIVYTSKYIKTLNDLAQSTNKNIHFMMGKMRVDLSIEENKQCMFIDKGNWITTDRWSSIDRGEDGDHPGPQSHRLYADTVLQYMKERGIDINE